MNFADPIHRHAVEMPEAVAVFTPQGTLAWQQLDRMVSASALMLHEAGVREAMRIGITMRHPLIHLVASLALTRLGAAQIALPVAEDVQARQAVQTRLNLSAILADSDNVEVAGIRRIVLGRLQAPPIDEAALSRISSSRGNLGWLILQSSGTTGAPKYAELTHQGAQMRLDRYRPLFSTGPGDIFWAASKLDFVVAKQRTFHSLLTGAAICLPIGTGDINAMVDFLNDTGVTLACGTPSHLHRLIEAGQALPTLRVFEARSAMIDEKLRARFKAIVSPHLYIVYGTNEGEALAMATPALQQSVANTVGLATASIDLEIVDPQGHPVPAGTTGEIRARGPGVIAAYLDNPDATARSFRDGWFHPGDLGYLSPEGALILQGRKDDMMIFDGVNIYPAEIENALAAHPAVDEVAAFPIRHEKLQDVPCAAVTLNRTVTLEELSAHCRTLLGVKAPHHLLLLKEFPRNAMGKILRRELAARIANS